MMINVERLLFVFVVFKETAYGGPVGRVGSAENNAKLELLKLLSSDYFASNENLNQNNIIAQSGPYEPSYKSKYRNSPRHFSGASRDHVDDTQFKNFDFQNGKFAVSWLEDVENEQQKGEESRYYEVREPVINHFYPPPEFSGFGHGHGHGTHRHHPSHNDPNNCFPFGNHKNSMPPYARGTVTPSIATTTSASIISSSNPVPGILSSEAPGIDIRVGTDDDAIVFPE